MRIPISSVNSGVLNDGALSGQINESLHHAVISNVQLATNRYILRMDYDKGTFTDITSLINANTATAFMGATADLNAGDGVLVACDEEVTEIGINLSTPGVGNWTSIKIYDSTNGTTFNREITGFTDNTGVFKNSGWRDIILPANAFVGRVALTPSPILGIASRKWVLIKISNPTYTVTTAPIVSGMYLRHHEEDKWINLTANSNDSLTVTPTGVQFHPAIGSIVAYFFDGLPVGWERYIFEEQGNVRTRILRYATDVAGTVFSDLQNVVDLSSDFTVAPNAQPQKFSVRWTPPSDAVKVTRTFTLVDNTTLTITNKYMVVIETTAITSIAPINPTLARVRAKMLGDAGTSGVVTSAHSVKRMTLKRHGSAVGTGNIKYQLYNFTQEKSVNLSFPDTDNNLEQNYDVSDLAFSDGDKRGMYHASGSRNVSDLEIEFHR